MSKLPGLDHITSLSEQRNGKCTCVQWNLLTQFTLPSHLTILWGNQNNKPMKKNQKAHVGGDEQECGRSYLYQPVCCQHSWCPRPLSASPHSTLHAVGHRMEHIINMLHDTLIYMVYVYSGHNQFHAWSLRCTFSEESNKQLQLLSPSRCSTQEVDW